MSGPISTRKWVDPPALLVAALGVGFAVWLVLSASAPVDFDLTLFIKTGADSTATRHEIEGLLGPVVLAPGLGHDGQAFFLLAQDPFLLEAGRYTASMEDPAYRARRMLYPAIAGLLGLLSPRAIVTGLVLVNVLAMGVGSFFTARLAQVTGRSGWLGLAFAANIGMIYELLVDGGGLLAWGLAVGGLLYLVQGRPGRAGLLLTGAVLARELMLLVVVGAALWQRRGRGLLALVVPPITAIAVWMAWVALRLGGAGITPQRFGPPLRGLLDVIGAWELVDYLVAGAVAASSAVVIRSWWRFRDPIATSVLGFPVVALFLSSLVWVRFSDFGRVLAPLITAALVAASPVMAER